MALATSRRGGGVGLGAVPLVPRQQPDVVSPPSLVPAPRRRALSPRARRGVRSAAPRILPLLDAGAAGLALAWWSPWVAVAGAAGWPLLLALGQGHRPSVLGISRQTVHQLLLAGAGLGTALALAAPVTGRTLQAWQVLLPVLATVAASLLTRTVIDRLVRGAGAPRLLVVGSRHDLGRALPHLRAGAGSVSMVVANRSLGIKLVEQVREAVSRHRPDGVLVVPGQSCDPSTVRRLGWLLESLDIELYVASSLLDVDQRRIHGFRVGQLGVHHVHGKLTQGPRHRAKEFGERVAAAIGLVLLAPLLAAIAIAVRWDSPGSAFYRQQRVGRDGVPFTMLKFRTMTTDSDQRRSRLESLNQADGVLFKMRDDPRVTRLGRALRKYSLDELPQLFNVVRGEMALVGPRPGLESEVAAYPQDMLRRLVVKPGLTGLWQVSGRSDLSWEESMRLDLTYVDNWSLGSDLRILLRTVGAVLGHRGAY